MKEKLRILLLFTFKISLKKWDKYGLLNREILLYKELQKKKNRIHLFNIWR